MKGKFDDLFLLIKSLTKSEKRFFHLSASIQKGEKNYTKLFDAIEKQKVYDEDALRISFKKEKFIRHLPYEKNYLYNILLKTLNEYKSGNSERLLVQQLTDKAYLLYEKGLFDQSGKMLKRAKERAYTQELYSLLLPIFRLERLLIEGSSISRDVTSHAAGIFKEQREALRKIENIDDYNELNYKINTSIITIGTRVDANIEYLVDHPLLSSPDKALTPTAQIYYYNILSTYWTVKGDYKKVYIYTRSLVELFEKNNVMGSGRYISILNNHLNSCYLLQRYDEMKIVIKKLRNIATSSRELKARIFMRSYNHEIAMLNRTGNSKEGLVLMGKINDGLIEYDEMINREMRFILYYNFTYMYIGAGQFKKALLWLNRIQQNIEKTLRDDLRNSILILSLIIHYELGNDSLLPYIVRSIYRALKKKKNLFKTEILLVEFFGKILQKVYSKKELTAAFISLVKKTKVIVKDPYENKIIMEYFDYVSWLESKIQNRSFGEIVKEKSSVRF